MIVDMTNVRGAVLASQDQLKHFDLDRVIRAYTVHHATRDAESRAIDLHKALVENGFTWRNVVTFYTRHEGQFL